MQSVRKAAAAMAVMACSLAACGGDGGGSTTTAAAATGTAGTVAASSTTGADSTTTAAADSTTTTAAGGDDSASPGAWTGLLAAIPSSPDMAASIVVSDYQAARALLDMAVPAADADQDEIIEYLLSLQVGPVADDPNQPLERFPRMGMADDSFGRQGPYDVAAWRGAFGIAVVDVDRTVVAGVPPATLTVWEGGRIEGDRVAEAVASDPEWSAELRTVEHAGEVYYAWGGDPVMSDFERTGPVRPLGQGGCLFAVDGLALRAAVCEVIEASLDARAGAADSLADVEPLARLAQALQDAGAYAAFLTLDVGLFSVGATPSPSGSAPSGPGLVPYLAAATGAALEAETSITLVGLVHGSAEDAAENVVRLQRVVAEGVSGALGRPWSEFLSVVDITTDDTVLVARLATEGPGNLWLRLVGLRDTLLAWE
jgi:hypothetical protein